MKTQITSANINTRIIRPLAILLAIGLLTPLACRAQDILQTGSGGTTVHNNSTATDETLKSISNPSADGSGTRMIFNGVLNLDAAHGITKSNNTGIFVVVVDNNSSPSSWANGSMVMAGDDAGVGGGTFAKFSAPVGNVSGIAFVGTLALSGTLVTKANDTGIWAIAEDSRSPFNSGPVAREGDPAPNSAGNPSDYTYKTFSGLALPDDTAYGPVFLAKVTNGSLSKTCLYGCPSYGSPVVELVAVGDLSTNADLGTTKPIKSFDVLKSKAGLFSTKPFVQNGVDLSGYLVLQVTYRDKTQAIVRVFYN